MYEAALAELGFVVLSEGEFEGAPTSCSGAAVVTTSQDNGPPGVRREYSGSYYAAFVLDPDGNSVEAVFHTPTESITE